MQFHLSSRIGCLVSLILLSACVSVSRASNPPSTQYPPDWWAPAPTEGKPDWEILPQDAGPGEVILSKRNELGIFSNFAATPFTLDGKSYASVEGFWQMMKFPEDANDPRMQGVTWPNTRDEVAQMTSFTAKHAGDVGSANMKTLGIDWVSYNGEHFPYRSATPARHYELIIRAMCAKIAQNPSVRDLLVRTGDLVLKPDHVQDPNDPPEWRYYEIWMKIRDDLTRDPAAQPATPFCPTSPTSTEKT